MSAVTDKAAVLAEVLEALDQRLYVDAGEPIDFEHDPPDGFEELAVRRSWAHQLVQAAGAVRSRYDVAIAELLGEGGVARFGDDFMRYSKKPDVTVTPQFVEWLATLTAAEVLAVLPKASRFLKGGLKAIAEARGLDPKVLEDTFTVTDWDVDPKLTVMPVANSRAPKYAASMESGEIRRRS